MKLKSVEAFCHVVEQGGIGPAAAEMYCVPSNITKMIKELESELREPLFERIKGRLILTPFGSSYYQDVKTLIAYSGEINKKYQKGNFWSSLTIGAIDVAAEYWLPSRISSFMQKNRHIDINMLNAHSRVLEEGLISRQLDIIFSDGPIENPEVTSMLAFEEQLILAGNPDAIGRSPIPLYSFGKACLYHDRVNQWLAGQPIGQYQITLMESYRAIITLVEQHQGMSFIPGRVLNHARPDLCHPHAEMITSNVHIAWHRFNPHQAVTALLDFLRSGH